MTENKSVLQEWVTTSGLTLKQQTALLCSLRGCDGVPKDDTSKYAVQTLRQIILLNADERTTFINQNMFLGKLDDRKEMVDFIKNIDMYPVHFIVHMVDAYEIIMYYHPDKNIRNWAKQAYFSIAGKMHLNIETKERCEKRLRDYIKKD